MCLKEGEVCGKMFSNISIVTLVTQGCQLLSFSLTFRIKFINTEMRMPGFQHTLLATQRDLPRVEICNKNWLFTVVSIQLLSKFQHRNAFSQSLRRLASETCNCSLSPHRWNLCFDIIVSLHVMRGKSIYQRYVTTLQAFTRQLARFKCLQYKNLSGPVQIWS